jgi:hypothetical protein
LHHFLVVLFFWLSHLLVSLAFVFGFFDQLSLLNFSFFFEAAI